MARVDEALGVELDQFQWVEVGELDVDVFQGVLEAPHQNPSHLRKRCLHIPVLVETVSLNYLV